MFPKAACNLLNTGIPIFMQKKQFSEIRILNSGEMPPDRRILMKDFNQIAFVFAQKLQEQGFRVEKFPIVYFILDPDSPNDQIVSSIPDYVMKNTLQVQVGFTECIDSSDRIKRFANFLGKHLTAVSKRLGCNDSELIKNVEDLIVRNGLDISITLAKKQTAQFFVSVFFKCQRKAVKEEESFEIDFELDYIPEVAVFMEVRNLKSDLTHSQFLFTTSPLFVHLMVSKLTIDGNDIVLVPKSSTRAKSILNTLVYPSRFSLATALL